MNRSLFASAQPLDIRPAIGQRWVLSFTEQECIEKANEIKEERREMMLSFWKSQRERGFVIIGENGDNWITIAQPVNPHPRMRARELKKVWLKNYKFKGFEAIK